MLPKCDQFEIRTENLGAARQSTGKEKHDLNAFPAEIQQFLVCGWQRCRWTEFFRKQAGTFSAAPTAHFVRVTVRSTHWKSPARSKTLFAYAAGFSPRSPQRKKGARRCFSQSLTLPRRNPGGGGVASGGCAPREPGCSAGPRVHSLSSSAPPKLLTADFAPSSVAKKPWRSPGAVCTFGCVWLQRWRLSSWDFWWVSVQTPSPQPRAAGPPRRKPGWAVLGSLGRWAQSQFWWWTPGVSATLEAEWNAFGPSY